MEAFIWKPEYSVSVSILDAQHKNLLQLVQDLHDAIESGRSTGIQICCLNVILESMLAHIAAEEDLLAGHEYSGLSQHQFEHVQLVQRTTDLQKSLAEGNTPANLAEIIHRSMTNHIVQTDYYYGNFFNRLGVY